jgi:hypothetical protein
MARLPTLQVTRGIAANLVVLSHLSIIEAKYTSGQILPAFAFCGTTGVDIFFVLSGFIMVIVAGKGIGAVQFLWRRIARIYPADVEEFSHPKSSLGATDAQVLEDAEHLIAVWNELQAKRMPMLFSPTIGAAIAACYWFLWYAVRPVGPFSGY